MFSINKFRSEFRYNLKLAYPVMIGQLAHMLVALVDNVMVGQLGAIPLAAVSLGNSFVYIALSIGMGFSFAITPLVAESHSKGDVSAGRLYLWQGLRMCLLLGILLVITLFLAKPLLSYMDQPPEVVALAIPYLEIVAISMLPLMVFQGFKQFSDGMSETSYGMYATLIANGINIIFNYLFIYGIWVFPELGMVGAAWGTLISRVCMLLFMLFLMRKKQGFRAYMRWHLRGRFNKRVMKRLISMGFPTSLQMFFEVTVFTAAIFLAGMLGVISQAANQIALNLASLTFMIAVGLSVTATIRVGNQKGRMNFAELRRIAGSIFMLTLLFQSCFAIIFFFGRHMLPTMYIDDAEVIAVTASLLLVAALFQISDGLQVVFLGALRGLQDVIVPSLLCFIAYGLVAFPLMYYLGFYTDLGATGIWIGLFVGLSVSAILQFVRFERLSRKWLHKVL